MLLILGGTILAGAIIAAVHRWPPTRKLRFWAVALVVAAGLYIGFDAIGNAPTGALLIEAGGVVIFSILAILGIRYSPWLLAGAWIAHIAWDTLLHSPAKLYAPAWYPSACIGFDLVVAIYLAIAFRSFSRATTAKRIAP